jgi:hypothetical protein
VRRIVAECPERGILMPPVIRVNEAAGRASDTRTVVGTGGAERLAASVRKSVMGNCPAVVGVPDSTPCELKFRPMVSGGVSDQANGARPLLAVKGCGV